MPALKSWMMGQAAKRGEEYERQLKEWRAGAGAEARPGVDQTRAEAGEQKEADKEDSDKDEEAKSEAEEKRRTQFDADTEEERIRERNTRPAEDIVMRREQGNRQIYIDAVSQLRTRAEEQERQLHQSSPTLW